MMKKIVSFVCMVALLLSANFPAFAQEQISVAPSTPHQSKIVDVSLTEQGVLQGQVISPQGQAIDGASVIISRDQVKLLETTTNKSGIFGVTGMQSGLYQIDTPQKSQIVRVWSHEIAPESSKQVATLVQDEATVRGQFGYADPVSVVSLGLGIAAVTLAAISLDKITKVEKRTQTPASP